MPDRDSQTDRFSHILTSCSLPVTAGERLLSAEHSPSMRRKRTAGKPALPRPRPAHRQHVFFRGDPPTSRETEQDSFALSHGSVPHGAGIWQEGNAGRAPAKLLSTLLLFTLPSSLTQPALSGLLLLSERSHQGPGSDSINPVPVCYRPFPAYNPNRFLSLFIQAPSRLRQS